MISLLFKMSAAHLVLFLVLYPDCGIRKVPIGDVLAPLDIQ